MAESPDRRKLRQAGQYEETSGRPRNAARRQFEHCRPAGCRTKGTHPLLVPLFRQTVTEESGLPGRCCCWPPACTASTCSPFSCVAVGAAAEVPDDARAHVPGALAGGDGASRGARMGVLGVSVPRQVIRDRTLQSGADDPGVQAAAAGNPVSRRSFCGTPTQSQRLGGVIELVVPEEVDLADAAVGHRKPAHRCRRAATDVAVRSRMQPQTPTPFWSLKAHSAWPRHCPRVGLVADTPQSVVEHPVVDDAEAQRMVFVGLAEETDGDEGLLLHLGLGDPVTGYASERRRSRGRPNRRRRRSCPTGRPGRGRPPLRAGASRR